MALTAAEENWVRAEAAKAARLAGYQAAVEARRLRCVARKAAMRADPNQARARAAYEAAEAADPDPVPPDEIIGGR